MPWKSSSKEEQRLDLVQQMIAGKTPVTELCQRFRISRQTAYKWRREFRRRPRLSLKDQSRRPACQAGQTSPLWLRRIRRERRRHPTWGGRKLRHQLVDHFGARTAPGTATITRWLKRWGLSMRRRRRPRRGPLISQKPLHVPERCHEVWTVDFKGWYRTADGVRVEPLTVRDLLSRFVLRIALLPAATILQTRRECAKLFAEHGLPQRIRCDNGAPFGGAGPTGLTRLSAWWVKLGIAVEFITPGRPCENGGHEQFHRVYKAEVAAKPARSLRAQQARGELWRRHYNQERPHEALGMRTPAEVFKKKRSRPHRKLKLWEYPEGWQRRWVKGNGEINLAGVRRYVGEAFVLDYVGLKPVRRGLWRVYFGKTRVGDLYENESGSIRMAKYRRRK
jgi:putative transposase